MLFKSYNGDDIIYSETFEGVNLKIYEPFKYKVSKHAYLPPSIVRFASKTVIFPEVLECHPQTTLEDIEIKD